jgi:hypothetical protein
MTAYWFIGGCQSIRQPQAWQARCDGCVPLCFFDSKGIERGVFGLPPPFVSQDKVTCCLAVLKDPASIALGNT